jgi:hypothetical protein
MSVESGVGVACGCLPGCKPLMNRMFPRIFASTSQSNSYPRAPGQARAGKKLDETNSTGQGSIQLASLRSDQVIVSEKKQDVEALPAMPPPSRQSRRMQFGRSGRSSRSRRYGSLDDESDSSSDMIILQRGDGEEKNWPLDGRKV